MKANTDWKETIKKNFDELIKDAKHSGKALDAQCEFIGSQIARMYPENYIAVACNKSKDSTNYRAHSANEHTLYRKNDGIEY